MAKRMLWGGVALAVAIRFLLAYMGLQQHLSRRVEVVTPITSPMRLAEGHWLKKMGLSPYAGSAYHGSPLLLALLGPLTKNGAEAWSTLRFFSSVLAFVTADVWGALLLHSIGALLETSKKRYKKIPRGSPGIKSPLASQDSDNTHRVQENMEEDHGPTKLGLRDIAAILYLLNPFTIAGCVGGTTSPFENAMVILSLYGAIAGKIPLATFGWAISTHLSMYPAILIIPITLLIIFGADGPQQKVLDLYNIWSRLVDKEASSQRSDMRREEDEDHQLKRDLYRVGVIEILFWAALWWFCIMALCSLALGGWAHLPEMISETYGYILAVEDLSPNLGLFWYFFTEVFTHFRSFFVMVFHANILFVIVPLTIRLHHRPFFLAFIIIAITTLLKSYPSVGDAALTLGLMALCTPDLTGFRHSFVILYGYLFVAILSPSMYNLWIWRGTGNANFYFAMALVYSALQSILIVESVGSVIRVDRKLKIEMEQQCEAVDDCKVQNETVGEDS